MNRNWIEDIIKAAALVVLLSLTSGCASMTAPSLLATANDPGTQAQQPISDKVIYQFSEALRVWWGSRSMQAEGWGTATLIGMDLLTTGALASAGGGINPNVSRGLIAAVDFVKAAFQRVDPRSRDGAFNSGSTIILESQGEYLACITQKRSAVPSEKTVSPCGAKFLAKINSGVAVVGSLMVGTLPSKGDLDNVTKPVTAPMPVE